MAFYKYIQLLVYHSTDLSRETNPATLVVQAMNQHSNMLAVSNVGDHVYAGLMYAHLSPNSCHTAQATAYIALLAPPYVLGMSSILTEPRVPALALMPSIYVNMDGDSYVLHKIQSLNLPGGTNQVLEESQS
jgi:hypothetical protein